MTPKRAAAYIVVASLLAAWLATAGGPVQQGSREPSPTEAVRTSGTETLAADVHAQALRLRERLAAAPEPAEPTRNPFAFAPRHVRASPTPAPPAALVPEATVGMESAPEPSLALIGVAEDQSPKGFVRTAIITAADDDMFMATEGDVIGGRYRVTRIGTDTAELSDLVTGAIRRLALH